MYPPQLFPWVRVVTGTASLAGGAATAGLLGVTGLERWILSWTLGREAGTGQPFVLRTVVGGVIVARLLNPQLTMFQIAIGLRLAAGQTDCQIANVGAAGALVTHWTIIFADAPPNVFSPLNISTFG